jgi:hypothetical protein
MGWSNKDGKDIPKIYRRIRRIHQNHVDEAVFVESSLIFAHKLVAWFACGVIFES